MFTAEEQVKKFVKRCKYFKKFPDGRVYTGRGRANSAADAITLDYISSIANTIALESKRIVDEIKGEK